MSRYFVERVLMYTYRPSLINLFQSLVRQTWVSGPEIGDVILRGGLHFVIRGTNHVLYELFTFDNNNYS